MDLMPELSVGCLQKIIKEKEHKSVSSAEDKPVVQIIETKLMSTGSVRCILFDGVNTTKQTVLKSSQQITAFYESKQLDNYSVIRLDQYWVSSIVGPNDIELIIISDITPIMRGSQINKKLEVFPEFDEPMDELFGQPLDHSFTSSANELSSVKNSFNPNYRPRNQTTTPSAVVPIDKSKRCLIKDIHPFFNSFVIRVKIATKTAIKTYRGRDGKEGKLFSFEATDESSEIRITAFNSECDKFFDIIDKDLIYFIFKGNVKTANKKYSNLDSDYEITLNGDTLIELCDEPVLLPSLQFKFVPIGQLSAQNTGNSVDVLGIITNMSDLESVLTKKAQKEVKKRVVSLIDKSLHEVRLTLWTELAENFSASTGQVLAIKNALIGEFRGKTLSSVHNSIVELDPDFFDAHSLKGWYDREVRDGSLRHIIPLSKVKDESNAQMKYLSQISVNTIPEDSPLYYNCKLTILSTNRIDRHLYKSCVNKTCLKKVKEQNNFYFCEKCGNNSPEFEWRLMLSLHCMDTTTDIWITAFQEVAEKLMGKTVHQLSDLFESDPNEYQKLIYGLNFKSFIFRIGSKLDVYNNEKRVKSTCYEVTPINAINRSKKLIQTIKSLTN